MKSVYVSISTSLVKLSIDDWLYDGAVREALGDVDNSLQAIHPYLGMLCLYALASVDAFSTGNPEAAAAKAKFAEKGLVAGVAALWRFNQTVTKEHDALLQVDYDKNKPLAIKGYQYNQFNRSAKPHLDIEFGSDTESASHTRH
jgi:hypothetical protein